VLYCSASDSLWHEAGHGIAFKTSWMNDVVYQIAYFMIGLNPATWRWSHTRQHTDTIIIELDPEIAVMRPPVLFLVAMNFFGIFGFFDWHKDYNNQCLRKSDA
jgi:fatty acid desaturase